MSKETREPCHFLKFENVKGKTELGSEWIRIMLTLHITLNIHWRGPKVKLRQTRLQVWDVAGAQRRWGEHPLEGAVILPEAAKVEIPKRETRFNTFRKSGG